MLKSKIVDPSLVFFNDFKSIQYELQMGKLFAKVRFRMVLPKKIYKLLYIIL